MIALDQRSDIRQHRRDSARFERAITVAAMAVASVFVALALVSQLAPSSLALGSWLPVHLMFVGAAGTAIAGVMPFFSATVSKGVPARPWIRVASIAASAGGAFLIVAGRINAPAPFGPQTWIPALGGIVFISEMILTGAATLLPLRSALGVRRVAIGAVYGIAVVDVIVGASLASLLLLGWRPVLDNWDALKPAHVWLNVFGFLSLVIAGSLLHLLPTVAGTRIVRTPAMILCYAGIAAGPPLAAMGFALRSDALALAGALLLLTGAVALGAHALDVYRRRGRWTSDLAWHGFAIWSLIAACAWFVVGTAGAAALLIASIVNGGPWQVEPLLATIGIGWIVQVLIGSWSHLLPSIGPGSPQRHARQRRILGTAAALRVVALNLGIALLAVAALTTLDVLPIVGAALVGLAVGSAVLAFGVALAARPDAPA